MLLAIGYRPQKSPPIICLALAVLHTKYLPRDTPYLPTYRPTAAEGWVSRQLGTIPGCLFALLTKDRSYALRFDTRNSLC